VVIIGDMDTEVKIAEFKSRLSEYLRLVRKGHEIVIKDRDTPIVRVVPYQGQPERLVTKLPTKSPSEIDKLPGIRPKKLKPGDLERAIRENKRDWLDKWMESRSTSTPR
jgi:prevent-host-death family protein